MSSYKDLINLPSFNLTAECNWDNSNTSNTWVISEGGTALISQNPNLFQRIGYIMDNNVETDILPSTKMFRLNDIIYGNGKYVVGGTGGFLASTTNLLNWTVASTGTTFPILSLAYGKGLYLFGCGDESNYPGGYNLLKSSTNAINWSTVTLSTSTVAIRGLAYGKGLYVVGDYYTINTSTNTINWTLNSLANPFTEKIVFNGTNFIAAGSSGKANTSTNAINWTTVSIYSLSDDIYNYVLGNGVHLVVSNGGKLSTSTNLNNWTTRTSGTTFNIYAVSYNNGRYIYGAEHGIIGTSTNAVNWTSSTQSTSTIRALLKDTTTAIFSGYLSLASSTNSSNWTSIIPVINDIDYGNGIYIYAGNLALLKTSTNAINWTARTSGTTKNINSVIYGKGLFVYCADDGVLASSTNAINWTSRTSGTTFNIEKLTYGNGLYVYGGVGGIIASSTNAINWTSRTSGTTADIISSHYSSVFNRFYFGTNSTTLLTSTNVINWQILGLSYSPLTSITSGVDGVLVGSRYLLYSTNGTSFSTGLYLDYFDIDYNGEVVFDNGYVAYNSGVYVLAQSSGELTYKRSLNSGNINDRASSNVNFSVSSIKQTSDGLFLIGGYFEGLSSFNIYTYNPQTSFKLPTGVAITANNISDLYIKGG